MVSKATNILDSFVFNLVEKLCNYQNILIWIWEGVKRLSIQLPSPSICPEHYHSDAAQNLREFIGFLGLVRHTNFPNCFNITTDRGSTEQDFWKQFLDESNGSWKPFPINYFYSINKSIELAIGCPLSSQMVSNLIKTGAGSKAWAVPQPQQPDPEQEEAPYLAPAFDLCW
jgi:hypothetical protein